MRKIRLPRNFKRADLQDDAERFDDEERHRRKTAELPA